MSRLDPALLDDAKRLADAHPESPWCHLGGSPGGRLGDTFIFGGAGGPEVISRRSSLHQLKRLQLVAPPRLAEQPPSVTLPLSGGECSLSVAPATLEELRAVLSARKAAATAPPALPGSAESAAPGIAGPSIEASVDRALDMMEAIARRAAKRRAVAGLKLSAQLKFGLGELALEIEYDLEELRED